MKVSMDQGSVRDCCEAKGYESIHHVGINTVRADKTTRHTCCGPLDLKIFVSLQSAVDGGACVIDRASAFLDPKDAQFAVMKIVTCNTIRLFFCRC